MAKAWNAIPEGRKARIFKGQIWNHRLGSFVLKQCHCMAYTQTLLWLKTQPRFSPFSWSLFMAKATWCTTLCYTSVDLALPCKPTWLGLFCLSCLGLLLKWIFCEQICLEQTTFFKISMVARNSMLPYRIKKHWSLCWTN